MNDLHIPHITDRQGFKPFTRLLVTPPAWPWDQARAARLEAQHTSPVSGDDVNILVRRLKPWALGKSGKFVAIYLRHTDRLSRLKFDLDVQGQRIAIDIPSPQQKSDIASSRLWQLGLTATMIACVLMMGVLAIQRRTAEAEQLDSLETQMSQTVQAATGVARARDDAEALSHLETRNYTMDQALLDLRNLSTQRDHAVQIDAFYWNKGYWAVETRGINTPIKDASLPLQRSDKPVRKGVWLWVSANEDGKS